MNGEIPDFYSSVESFSIVFDKDDDNETDAGMSSSFLSLLPRILNISNYSNYYIVVLDGQIVLLALGRTHSLSLTSKGLLFAMGHGEEGQLGLGISSLPTFSFFLFLYSLLLFTQVILLIVKSQNK